MKSYVDVLFYRSISDHPRGCQKKNVKTNKSIWNNVMSINKCMRIKTKNQS